MSTLSELYLRKSKLLDQLELLNKDIKLKVQYKENYVDGIFDRIIVWSSMDTETMNIDGVKELLITQTNLLLAEVTKEINKLEGK